MSIYADLRANRLFIKQYHDKAEAIAAFSEASYSDEFDFVEALIYANDKWVLMKGVLCDSPDETVGNINAIGKYYK